MSLSLTPKLQKHLGILPLHLKNSEPEALSVPAERDNNTTAVIEKSTPSAPVMPKPELEKNEFRLLVKILQAIGHECIFDRISYKNGVVHYAHPKKNLVFGDISVQDDPQTLNLSSLKDMNEYTALKRAVWEKLKSLA